MSVRVLQGQCKDRPRVVTVPRPTATLGIVEQDRTWRGIPYFIDVAKDAGKRFSFCRYKSNVFLGDRICEFFCFDA